MNKEFHEPFIRGMIIVGVITLITMFTSKFVVEYYMTLSPYSHKTIEYSSQKSQDEPISSLNQ